MMIDELNYLIDYMIAENESINIINPHRYNRKRDLFRILCGIRFPKPIDEEFLKRYDKYLDSLINEKNIIDVKEIKTLKEQYQNVSFRNADKIAIFKGDITSIKIDAILNSANRRMQGCYVPLHKGCVDNAIHFFAGIELKNACVETLKNRNLPFIATGKGMITDSFHLPCDKIIHMVAPICNGFPKESEYNLLMQTYRRALKRLVRNDLKSIALCAMGTGKSKFPKKETFKRALDEIDVFLDENRENIEKIVFVVYTLEEYKLLEEIILKDNAYDKTAMPKKYSTIPKTSKIMPKKDKEKLKELEENKKDEKTENGRLIINEMVERLSGENNIFVNQDYIRKPDRPKYEKIIYTLLPEEEIIYDDDSFLEEMKKARRRKSSKTK